MRELKPNETYSIGSAKIICVADGTLGANCGKCVFKDGNCNFDTHCYPDSRKDKQYVHFEAETSNIIRQSL